MCPAAVLGAGEREQRHAQLADSAKALKLRPIHQFEHKLAVVAGQRDQVVNRIADDLQTCAHERLVYLTQF
jgi:hypothetical protein